MGLIDNTKRIETALTEKNRKEQEKEAERRKKQQEKDNKTRLEKDIKRNLEAEFYKYFELYGSNYITEFYNIERKNNIFKCILEEHGEPITTYFINKSTGRTEKKITKYKNESTIKDIFNKYYYKILQEQYQIFKKYDLYLEELEQEQQEQEQEEAERIQEQEEQRQKIWRIAEATGKAAIKILIFILLGIITLITAALKSSK